MPISPARPKRHNHAVEQETASGGAIFFFRTENRAGRKPIFFPDQRFLRRPSSMIVHITHHPHAADAHRVVQANEKKRQAFRIELPRSDSFVDGP